MLVVSISLDGFAADKGSIIWRVLNICDGAIL